MEQDQGQQSSARSNYCETLPPKHRILQHWRESQTASDTGADSSTDHKEAAVAREVQQPALHELKPSLPSVLAYSSLKRTEREQQVDETLEDVNQGELFQDDPLKRGQKCLKLAHSKIQGLAEPRKPRIGPGFQAVIPPWTGPPAPKPQPQPPKQEAGADH